uniref:Uncharacterized protein n=1 Tax=Trichogramma kaykai TaxID=54128 RepID=A0ABD2WQB3_9HYME
MDPSSIFNCAVRVKDEPIDVSLIENNCNIIDKIPDTQNSVVQGLNCYQCGQYNDGVGSITPCINYTATQLKECPKTSEYCIVSKKTISLH